MKPILERRRYERASWERTAPTGFELDLVIPVLNEEQRIGPTLADIHREAVRSDLSVQILVVDNGCVDGTADVVARAKESGVPVEIISCRLRGKGAAVRTGILWSAAPYVGYTDADQSTPSSVIGSAIALLRSGFEVVIGSRRCTGAGYTVPQGGMRRLGSFAFRTMASRLSGPITDTQCGFKVFHSQVAKELFATSSIDGFAFDVEVLARARQRNHRMIELPILWSDSPESSFRPVTDGVRSFLELREARRSLLGPAPSASVGRP